ncbi:Uncharacterized protein Adt_41222 [Abeliophyllum distichum]|uniref:Btz domain-containing protein n=1 Tax=Abeliophyllum distichum TaxID=126358 RepID=A0ABD1PS51_9LAMI
MTDERNVGHPQESIRGRKPAPVKDVGYHQESVRERKPAPAKGRPYSPSQVPVGVGESAPAAANTNTAGEHEHKFPSGFRRNGNQNNRSGRGHESHGDWSSGHDSRQHNVPGFRERPRQNVHFEYQPVGQYKNSKTDKLVGFGDGSNDVAPRYRERNQSHYGGNFHRRQGGPAHD